MRRRYEIKIGYSGQGVFDGSNAQEGDLVAVGRKLQVSNPGYARKKRNDRLRADAFLTAEGVFTELCQVRIGHPEPVEGI